MTSQNVQQPTVKKDKKEDVPSVQESNPPIFVSEEIDKMISELDPPPNQSTKTVKHDDQVKQDKLREKEREKEKEKEYQKDHPKVEENVKDQQKVEENVSDQKLNQEEDQEEQSDSKPKERKTYRRPVNDSKFTLLPEYIGPVSKNIRKVKNDLEPARPFREFSISVSPMFFPKTETIPYYYITDRSHPLFKSAPYHLRFSTAGQPNSIIRKVTSASRIVQLDGEKKTGWVLGFDTSKVEYLGDNICKMGSQKYVMVPYDLYFQLANLLPSNINSK